MESKNRQYHFDNMKGILIFLVVLGHSLELFRKESFVAETLYIFIYMFHMPVFIFISGYFSKNLEKGRASAVRTFLIPYLFFNTIWNFIQLYAGVTPFFSFFTPGWALWYLFSMFLWKILLPDILKVKKVRGAAICIGLLSGFFAELGPFMSLSRSIVFFPFFLFGYYTNSDTIEHMKKKNKIYAVIIVIAAVIFSFFLANLRDFPAELLWGDRSYNSFTLKIWISFLINCGRYLTGFLFVFVLINLVPVKKSFISHLGENTFSVYILHTFLLVFVIGAVTLTKHPVLKFTVLLSGSLLITFLLSRDIVGLKLTAFLKKLTSIFSVKKK